MVLYAHARGTALSALNTTNFPLCCLVAFFLQSLGVCWATYSAGSLIVDEALMRRRPLMLYPLFLLYFYLFSLYSGV